MSLDPSFFSRRRLLALAGSAVAASVLGRFAFVRDAYADAASGPLPSTPGAGNWCSSAPAGVSVLGGAGQWALSEPRKIKLATNLNAVCLAPVAVADSQGFFREHNLEVEFVNFGHSTEVLLESLATGKADAAIGMALRWLKALEQGFDVKLTAGTHGGCLRLVALDEGPSSLEALKGTAIGVTDMASADKNFFSLLLKRHGVDPVRDVTWRVYPIDLLQVALQKGEIQAASGSDPIMHRIKSQPGFRELSSNLADDYANLSCCVVGVPGNLVRKDKPVAAALTHAILQAHAWAAQNPQAVAEEFLKSALNTSAEEVRTILGEHTHEHYALGEELVREIAVYARDLKAIDVLRARTDPLQFAESIHADVFA